MTTVAFSRRGFRIWVAVALCGFAVVWAGALLLLMLVPLTVWVLE